MDSSSATLISVGFLAFVSLILTFKYYSKCCRRNKVDIVAISSTSTQNGDAESTYKALQVSTNSPRLYSYMTRRVLASFPSLDRFLNHNLSWQDGVTLESGMYNFSSPRTTGMSSITTESETGKKEDGKVVNNNQTAEKTENETNNNGEPSNNGQSNRKSSNNGRSTDNMQSINNLQSIDNMQSINNGKSMDNMQSIKKGMSMDNMQSINNGKSMESMQSINKGKSMDNMQSINKVKSMDNMHSLNKGKSMDNMQSINKVKSIDNMQSINKLKSMDNMHSINKGKSMDNMQSNKGKSMDNIQSINKGKSIDNMQSINKDKSMARYPSTSTQISRVRVNSCSRILAYSIFSLVSAIPSISLGSFSTSLPNVNSHHTDTLSSAGGSRDMAVLWSTTLEGSNSGILTSTRME